MRRLSGLMLVVLVVTVVGCGRDEVPSPAVTEAPTPQVQPEQEIASHDLEVLVGDLPEGLSFNQVEEGSVSFFVGGDGRAVMEMNVLPGISARDLDAAEAAVRERDLEYLHRSSEVARESMSTASGAARWLLFQYDEDGEEIRSGWLLAPHPDGERVVSVTVKMPDGADADTARDQAVSLVEGLRTLG